MATWREYARVTARRFHLSRIVRPNLPSRRSSRGRAKDEKGPRCNSRGRFKKNRWRRAFSTKRGTDEGRKCALPPRWRNITVIIAVPRKFGRVGPFLAPMSARETGREACFIKRLSLHAMSRQSLVIARTIQKNNSISQLSHRRPSRGKLGRAINYRAR